MKAAEVLRISQINIVSALILQITGGQEDPFNTSKINCFYWNYFLKCFHIFYGTWHVTSFIFAIFLQCFCNIACYKYYPDHRDNVD